MLRYVLLIAIGASLIAFHRPIARWQQGRWKTWQGWPFNRLLPTQPLLAYIVPLLAVGLGFLVIGVLSLAGFVQWKQ